MRCGQSNLLCSSQKTYWVGPLLSSPPACPDTDPAASHPLPWFAIRVKPNFEKRVATALHSKGLEECLPLFRTRRRWSDRVKTIDCPLFSGYVFCRLDLERRLPIVTTPGFLYIVSAGNRPAPVEESEMAAIQSVIRSGLPALPWPFLAVGQRVRVEHGPLRGLEGTLAQLGKQNRICVSVTLLNRGISVEIDREWIRPLGPAPVGPLSAAGAGLDSQLYSRGISLPIA
jgi:transcription antitermination factor NusG